MDNSFRKTCLLTAYNLSNNNIATAGERLESIISDCLNHPDAIPFLNPLLNAIDNGHYDYASDILLYHLSNTKETILKNPLQTFINSQKQASIKFLIYEFAACMQTDLEKTLTKYHIEYDRFSYVFYKNFFLDEYFTNSLLEHLNNIKYTAVLSMNYWPLLAELCHKTGTPYICWIYDCPMPYSWKTTIEYETNHVFVFDKSQLWDAFDHGYKTVDYEPLAINPERLDSIKVTAEDKLKYKADVSFVGKLYTSRMHLFRPALTPQEDSYIDSLIDKQVDIHNMFFLKEMVSDRFADEIYKRYEDAGNPPPQKREFFPSWFNDELTFEVTNRERVRLMTAASERFLTKLYSPDSLNDAPKLVNLGAIDNGVDMIKMFKSSKINLNITYRGITSGIPLRILDILASGGFLLTNHQKELSYYFNPGRDFAEYETIEDALEKMEYYLTHEDERLQLAKNGHEAVKQFSFERRLGNILLRSLN